MEAYSRGARGGDQKGRAKRAEPTSFTAEEQFRLCISVCTKKLSERYGLPTFLLLSPNHNQQSAPEKQGAHK